MALNVVPGTGWQSVRGQHPGGLVTVSRVTDRSVFYRIVSEGAGTGPRSRGEKGRLDLDTFLRNYRPNSKKDWQIATTPMGPSEGEDTVTPSEADAVREEVINGRLHADEVAIADAIRGGAKFHEVQADFHVQGKVLAEIIKKFDVPYETIRERDAARPRREPVEATGAGEVPNVAVPDGPLHPQEEEIVEVMRSRAAGFHEVLRTYGVKGVTLAQIMARHGIPKQTAEERREKERLAYQARKARLEAEAQAALDAASQVTPKVEEAESVPVEAPASIVAEAVVPSVPTVIPSTAHTWRVVIRTEITTTVTGDTYIAAAQAALEGLDSHAEIISVARLLP